MLKNLNRRPLFKALSHYFLKRKLRDPFLDSSQTTVSSVEHTPRGLVGKFWFPLLVITAFIVFMVHHRMEMHQLKRAFNKLRKGLYISAPILGGTPIPPELRNIPLADSSEMILSVKNISLRNIVAPYNASILKRDGGYTLFFRYDLENLFEYPTNFYSYIGVAQLDENFDQTEEECITLDTKSDHSEDPRAVTVGDQTYIVYNDIHPGSPHKSSSRSMRVANLNMKDYTLNFVTHLDLHLQPVEKNWTPFEYIGEDRVPKLYFEYNINPHSILELANPRISQISHLIFPNLASPVRPPWPDMWGRPRGGAGAHKIGDEYLSFFHSSFRDKEGIVWYLMGAYTFEANPPFRITAISHYPILFDGIYDSPPLNTAPLKIRCIFPCGFIQEQQNGREVLHVVCGENDAAVKIVTMDQQLLLNSLKKLKIHHKRR